MRETLCEYAHEFMQAVCRQKLTFIFAGKYQKKYNGDYK